MSKIAVYPGSFDPITYGHINIIERAANHFDELHVLILNNVAKNYLFSVDERIKMTEKSISRLSNVKVKVYDNLLVNYVKENNVKGFKFIKCNVYKENIKQSSEKTDDYIQFASRNQKLYDSNFKLLSKNGRFYFKRG